MDRHYEVLWLLISAFAFAEACNNAVQLPELTRRGRNNIAEDNEPFISDFSLSEEWYSVTDNGLQYKMPDSNALPDFQRCGTFYVIYFQGVHPTVNEDEEVSGTACLRSYFSNCDLDYNIKLRNCSGSLQYHLPSTIRQSAYCFDPPEIQDIPDIPDAPDDINLGTVSVRPHLIHVPEPIAGLPDVSYNKPLLRFECHFNWDDELFYTVHWYINDNIEDERGPSDTNTTLLLTEETLLNKNIGLGINVKCGVAVSTALIGLRTSMTFSDNFFAGIKWSNLTYRISRNEGVTMKFKVTVPIGCVYVDGQPSHCFQELNMFDREYSCTDGGIQETLSEFGGIPQGTCGYDIPTVRSEDEWNIDEEYSIDIVTKDEHGADPNVFTLDFRFQNASLGRAHGIWRNYQPESISVIVEEAGAYKNKYCYSHVDPHIKTADGMRHEQQNEGQFVLYINIPYSIEVQEKTLRCFRAPRPTCTCAVAIRAGGDVFLIDICGTRFIGFKQCEDNGILRVREVTNTKYQIHTPIGTYIEIRLKTGRYQGFMNVDIFMSPKDVNSIQGLCGNFDNIIRNEYDIEDDPTVDTRDEFNAYWEVTNDQTNMFLPSYTAPNLWNQENPLFCHCEKIQGTDERINTSTCSASQYKSCDLVDDGSVTSNLCNRVSSRRRRRSLHSHIRGVPQRVVTSPGSPIETRFERSTVENITEDEAVAHCTEIIRNSMVASTLTELLDTDEIEAKIDQCIFDVMASNDLEFASIHVELLNSLTEFQIYRDPVYRAANEDKVLAFLRQACPLNCSNHGNCTDKGRCKCDEFYHGGDCSIDSRDHLTIDGVSGGGICDINVDSCNCFDVYSNNLLGTFYCRTQHIIEYVDGTRDEMESEISTGNQFSTFEGECCVPATRRRRSSHVDVFDTQYVLAISNDGNAFSENITIVVYDPTCQEFQTNQSSNIIVLKSGYCFINGICVAENEMDMLDACNYCNTSTASLTWTTNCSTTTTSVSSSSGADSTTSTSSVGSPGAMTSVSTTSSVGITGATTSVSTTSSVGNAGATTSASTTSSVGNTGATTSASTMSSVGNAGATTSASTTSSVGNAGATTSASTTSSVGNTGAVTSASTTTSVGHSGVGSSSVATAATVGVTSTIYSLSRTDDTTTVSKTAKADPSTRKASSDSNTTPIVVGVTVGIVVVIVVGGIVFYKKATRKKHIHVTNVTSEYTESTQKAHKDEVTVEADMNVVNTKDMGDNSKSTFSPNSLKPTSRPTTPFGGRESDITANFLANGLQIYLEDYE